MKTTLSVFLAAGLFATATSSIAQTQADQECRLIETIEACWDRVLNVDDNARKVARTAGKNAAALQADTETNGAAKVAKKTTGSSALGPGLASSITDFLSPVAAMLGVSRATTELGDSAFEANLPLPTTTQPIKFKALVRKPSVYSKLSEALPEKTRAERVAALTKAQGELDDVQLSATWSRDSAKYGRRMEGSQALFTRFFAAVVLRADADRQFREARNRALNKLGDSALIARCSADPTLRGAPTFDCYQDTDAALKAGNAAVSAQRKLNAALQETATNLGLEQFVDLVNNQSQVSVELASDIRNQIAGPKQNSLKVRYESGFRNVANLREHCKLRMEEDKTLLEDDDLNCISNYIKDSRESLAKADRVFASAEVLRRPLYEVSLATDKVTYSAPASWDVALSVGYGRYVRRGESQGRIDFSADYIHHTDDPKRQNRFVATATYTQRISDSVGLAVGASYASKPEFLGDVDKKMSANFGLRYRVTK